MAPEPTASPGKRDDKPALPLKKLLLLLGLQAATMGGLGCLLWLWSGRDTADFVSLSMPEIAQGAALAAILVAAAYASFRAFPKISEQLVRMQAKTYEFLGPKLGWPAIVAISISAGVGEEALFRGGLQTILGDHLGVPAAIVLSSALFAVIHMGKPVITALLFVVGGIFGVVYWLTGSLLAVMIGHALYDVWALRYLHREFVRLGLVGGEVDAASAGEPSLANPDARS